MSVTRDILATYRGPGGAFDRLLARGRREDRVLAMAMVSCILLFVAQWPVLQRRAMVDGVDLQMALAGALVGTVVVLPLLLYAVAGLSALVLRLLGVPTPGYAARLALVWSLFATVPLALLHGLVAGLIGPGPQQTAVGVIWLATFLWFWSSGLRRVAR